MEEKKWGVLHQKAALGSSPITADIPSSPWRTAHLQILHGGGPGLSSALQPDLLADGREVLEAIQLAHLGDTFTEGVGGLRSS